MVEELRLHAVKQFEELDLQSDRDLVYTIMLAAKVCETALSFISIIDDETEWVKVSNGVDYKKIPIALSFCQHAMKSNRLFIVNDMLKDSRFRNHPSVTGGSKYRFYASFPLITCDGYRVGTFCIGDTKPHTLTNKQKATLKMLSKHAASLMDLQLSVAQLDQSFVDIKLVRESKSDNEVKLRSMFESFTDAYYLLGKDGEVLDFNRTAYNFVLEVFDEKLTQGAIMSKYLTKSYVDTFALHYKNALKGEKALLERQADFGIHGKIWWECVFEPVRNDSAEIIGVSYVSRNINERKANEAEILAQNKSLLKIGEIQAHEYRAPLATILGLLDIIELEDYHLTKEYIVMLQHAARKLDHRIMDVIKIVESEFHGT